MNTKDFMTLILIYIVSISFTALILFGCGSSNPVADDTSQTAGNTSETETTKTLKVEIEVQNQTVKAGEQIRLTAKVQATPGAKLLYTWKVVDGEGAFDKIDQAAVIWTAPSSIPQGEVKLSVIQLTVTLVSQQFSGGGSNLKVEKEIQSVTKTLPITIVG